MMTFALLLLVQDPGWTKLAPSRDTRVIYVSWSAGSDAADGQAPARAVKTLAKGRSLLRHGYPDWMLLQAGDGWDEPLGPWKAGGRSRTEPLVVGAYGKGPRPRIRPGGKGACMVLPGGATPALEHLAFVGLDFHESTRDPADPLFNPAAPPAQGFFWTGEGNDILLEDCRFAFFKDALVFQKQAGRYLTDVRLRRCLVLDSWSTGSHAQGIYADEVDSLQIEECVFDHNGWNERVPGASRTMFNHNLYIQGNCRRVSVRGNLLARAASHGVQLRPGGAVEDNLFWRNAIAVTTGGDEARVERNVILESDDITPSLPRGWGIEMRRHAKSGIYRGNLLLQRASAADVAGLSFSQSPLPGAPPVIVADNVVSGWSCSVGGIFVAEKDAADVRLSGNVVDGKDAAGKPARLLDPRRSLEGYAATLKLKGGAPGFLEAARARERGAWDEKLSAPAANRWLRAGHMPAPSGPK